MAGGQHESTVANQYCTTNMKTSLSRSASAGEQPTTCHSVTQMYLQDMRTTVADGPVPGQGEPSNNTKSAVEAKVNEQYDSDASMAFYEHVMGGGGDDIHYGIFHKEKDGLKQSSQNSVEELAKMASECGALKQVLIISFCRLSVIIGRGVASFMSHASFNTVCPCRERTTAPFTFWIWDLARVGPPGG